MLRMDIARFLREYLSRRASEESSGTSNSSDEEPGVSLPRDSREVDAWERYFLLSLDGGGIRGLSALYILEDMMQKIGEIERQYDPNATHSFYPAQFVPPPGSVTKNDPSHAYRYFPCHYFDGMFGTSTGGLIAIMLGRLRMNVKDCIEEYKKLGGEVFGHPRRAHVRGKKRYLKFNPLRDKYHVGPLRGVINSTVSERDPLTLEKHNTADVGKATLGTPPGLCQTAVWSVEGSSNRDGWLFRSYRHPRQEAFLQRNHQKWDYPIEQVACATTAAPTYFKPTKIEHLVFYDGGLTATSPCQLAVAEIADLIQDKHRTGSNIHGYLGAVVSIGTGKVRRSSPKPPKSWLGRYDKAWSWQLRRGDNSAEADRGMRQYTRDARARLRQDGIADDSPFQFKYARFTVGGDGNRAEDREPVVPEDSNGDIGRMARMPIDEWIPEPDPNATVTRIYVATRAYLASPIIQQELREMARHLVVNRRRRSQCDQPATAENQSSSSGSVKWYRYATANQWRCDHSGCLWPGPYYTQTAMEEHVMAEHRVTWGQALVRREPCGYEEPYPCS